MYILYNSIYADIKYKKNNYNKFKTSRKNPKVYAM